MLEKPQHADGYQPEFVTLAKNICLTIVSKVGDLINEMMVVGGLVPTLLVDSGRTKEESHIGTIDVDMGIQFSLVDSQRYMELSTRLKRAGFQPALNSKGNPSFQRWVHTEVPDYELIGTLFEKQVKFDDALGYFKLALDQYQTTECDIPAKRVSFMINRAELILGIKK